MKKVLMLLDHPFVSDQRVEKEARGLAQCGFAVTVFATVRDSLPAEEVLARGVHVRRVFSNFFLQPLRPAYRQELQAAAKRVAQFEADIVHCHDFYMLEIGVQAKRIRPQIKLIYDAHEYLQGWPFYKYTHSLAGRLKGWVNYRYLLHRQRHNIKYADHVITTTEAIAISMMHDHKLKTLPLVIANIPARVEPAHRPENALRKIFGIPETTRIMVQAGNIYQTDKELVSQFDTVTGMKNVAFVIIGSHPRFYAVRQKSGEEPKYKGHIFFAEYDSATLYDMIGSADFGFMFTNESRSHFMSSPNRVYDYAFCGIPILSVEQYMVEQLQARYNCAVIFERNEPEGLKKGILKMLAVLEEKKAGTRAIPAELSWDREVQALTDLYRSLGM